MRKISLLTALIVLSGLAVAQVRPSAPAARGWDAEPSAVFGVQLGAPLDIADIHNCDYPQPAPQFPFCRTGHSKTTVVLSKFPVESVRTGMIGLNDEGKVERFMLLTEQSSYRLLKATLIERYGRPTEIFNESVQNNVGATFSSERLEWRGRVVSLSLIERSGRVDRTIASFEHLPSLDTATRRIRDQTKGDASKF